MNKQEIKLIKSLTDRKNRRQNRLFVVEGEKLCKEIIDSNFTISKLYYTDSAAIENEPYYSSIDCEKVQNSEMERISSLKSKSSMLIVANMPEDSTPRIVTDDITLVLDSVQDPGNLGTIIRICDWFGIRQIVCSNDTVDLYNTKVVQSTMGAISRVAVSYCDIAEYLTSVKNNNIPIYVTDLKGDNIYSTKLNRECVIVMGNEGKGVSDSIKSFATDSLLIPPYPADSSSCESLNVAVATAIICSEFRR